MGLKKRLPTTQSTPSPSLSFSILKIACHDPVDQHFSDINVSANHLQSDKMLTGF